MMIAGTSAYNLIRRFEGFRNRAYQCSAGVWTVGYGHTRNVSQSMVVTVSQAEEFLQQDVVECEMFLNRTVKVPLTQQQFDALVSFVFNIGGRNFQKSRLLSFLNDSQYDKVPMQMLQWCHCKGKVLTGLKRRREAEATLFKNGTIKNT